MDFGEKVRLIREGRNMTAKELADLAGCTTSLISQIENNVANPSINTLKKISEALKVPLVRFFETESFNGENTEEYIVRKNQRPSFSSETENAELSLLSPVNIKDKNIEMHLLKLSPGGRSEKKYVNNGEEVGYVVKGTLTVILQDKKCVLNEGDSIYFPGTIPHEWENNTDEECISIWAVTPPLLCDKEDVSRERKSYIPKQND